MISKNGFPGQGELQSRPGKPDKPLPGGRPDPKAQMRAALAAKKVRDAKSSPGKRRLLWGVRNYTPGTPVARSFGGGEGR